MAIRTTTPLPGTITERRGREREGVIARLVALRIHIVLAAIVVAVLSLQQSFSDIQKTRFHPDESRWLNRSHYTIDLFSPFSSVWEDRYLTRGQPPMGSYVTGVGIFVQGRDLDTNGPWDFRYGNEVNITWNATRGNMPAWDDLQAARRTSAVLGMLSTLCVFWIVTRITNVAGGLAAGVFFAVHPLNVYLSTLAVSDAAFTFFVALSAVLGMLLAERPTWRRSLALGLVLGAGAATKLSPLLLAVALAGVGVVLVSEPWLRRVRPLRWLLDRFPGTGTAHARELGWMLLPLPVITFLTFFLTYPFLWPSPVDRTWSLFEFRRDEMAAQARIWPQAAIDNRWEALQRTWWMLEDRYSTSGKVFSELMRAAGRDVSERGIDVPFAVAGLAILCVLARRRGITSPTFAALVVAGGQAALIVGGLQVDFDRYYLPIVFLFAIGIGVLTGAVWWLLSAVIERVRSTTARKAMGPLPDAA